jgi:hypothetical protein
MLRVRHAKAFSEIMDESGVVTRWTFAPHLIGTSTQDVIRKDIEQIAERKNRKSGTRYPTDGNPQGNLW